MRVPRSVTPRPFSRLPGRVLTRGADIESSALAMGVLRARFDDNADGKGQARQNAVGHRSTRPGKLFHNCGDIGARVTGYLRLWSGLVLLAYLATHLSNHALGLVSIEA